MTKRTLSLIPILLTSAMALSAALVAAGPVPPTNQLYGFISANRVLTKASPGPVYYVLGDLVVNPGVTLTVEPGVSLVFSANRDTLGGGDFPGLCELDVRGTLVAEGTIIDSVRFTSTGGEYREWGQIKVISGASIRLAYAVVAGAMQGLTVAGAGPVRMVDAVSIRGCVNGIDSWNATLALRRSQVVGVGLNGTGLNMGADVLTTPPDSLDVEPTTISGFYYGVIINATGSPRNMVVTDCVTGMADSGPGPATVSYCTVARNQTGMNISGNASQVIGCIAAFNSSIGFLLQGSAFGDYLDGWANAVNLIPSSRYGPYVSAFNPFFVDDTRGDYRLSSGSIFKYFGPAGGEIGAFGPGPGSHTRAEPTSWGRLKSLYR